LMLPSRVKPVACFIEKAFAVVGYVPLSVFIAILLFPHWRDFRFTST